MKKEIIELLNKGLTSSEIVKKLGCSKGTVSYHALKRGLVKRRIKRDWKVMQAYYDTGKTHKECAAHFKMKNSTWYNGVVNKNLIPRLLTGKEHLSHFNKTHEVTGRTLKRALKMEGVNYECELCKINTWSNKHLALEVDHINGDHCDNRRGNLRLLCPNCHSQTPTFRARNKKSAKAARGELASVSIASNL